MWKSILNQNNAKAILDIDAVIDFKDITKKLHTDLKTLRTIWSWKPKASLLYIRCLRFRNQ